MSQMLSILTDQFSDDLIGQHSEFDQDTLIIKRRAIKEVCHILKTSRDFNYDFLLDLTVVDFLGHGKTHRFEAVYHLYSMKMNHRLRIKVPISEDDCSIDSVVSVWDGANWMEREAYDMYGVVFNQHPDLRRILLYKEFVGYPLRKDYLITKRQPLIGPTDID